MSNQAITIKLNRFTSYLLQPTYKIQSPLPSPSNDFFTIILFYLQKCLNFILDSFTALFDKLKTIFPPETREKWLNAAAAHWLLIVVVLCLLCCCLPSILSCITRVFVTIFNLIKGFFDMILNGFKSVFRCLCCCGRRSMKMMKAPGRGGEVFIPRAGFESDPSGYFRSLRASSSYRVRY